MTHVDMNSNASRKERPSHLRDPLVRWTMIACAVGFGGFIAWAGFAPLEEGIAAVGKVIIEDDRQLSQKSPL